MHKLLVPALAIAVAAVCGQALAAGRSIKVGDNYFVRKGHPPTVRVAKGTRVTWRWKGSGYHDVHAVKGPRHFSSAVKRDGTFSRRLRRRGTYKIVCDIHSSKMRMTLKVY